MKQQNDTLIIYAVLIKRQKTIAWFLFCTFYLSFLQFAIAGNKNRNYHNFYLPLSSAPKNNKINSVRNNAELNLDKVNGIQNSISGNTPSLILKSATAIKLLSPTKATIGGPGQPEMATFKSIGADNMVSP